MSFNTSSTITITEGTKSGYYSTSANVQSFAGTAPTAIQQDFADKVIEMATNRVFKRTDTAVEIFDIDETDNIRNRLQLGKYPVISVTSIIDNWKESGATTLTEDTDSADGDYCIYKEIGEVRLVHEIGSIIKGFGYWTKGEQTVKATYTFGYATTPADVAKVADWYCAFLVEMDKNKAGLKNSDGAVLKSVSIGNYKEAFDVNNKLLKEKYEPYLTTMINDLRRKYYMVSD